MVSQIQQAIKQLHDSAPDRDYILISHEISMPLHGKLTEKIEANKKNKKCTLFLTTSGGDPHGGYRVARCLRHHYEHLRLVVPSYCKSAGTLIAISANELAIGDRGELGPLDVQVKNPTELQKNSSGLDIQEALQIVLNHSLEAFSSSLLAIRGAGLSTKLAGELATKIAEGIAAPLYAQIDPSRLGELQRAMKIAHEYGKRLNDSSDNLKRGGLEQLVTGYPSHGFVIDRKEARSIFKNVGLMSQEEEKISCLLGNILNFESDLEPTFLKVNDDAGAKYEKPTDNGVHSEPENNSTQRKQRTSKRSSKKTNENSDGFRKDDIKP